VEDGGPVTVVHPEITRYFMTIPEACQLTIQAGAIGEPGNVMVLDMGEPIRILDVAERIIRRSGKQVPIVFTGLRPGEKLHEVLFNEAEFPVRTQHPLISRVAVPPRDPETVRAMSPDTFLARHRVASA
jgi:dTDP-glucose 4,6-dehydratase